MCSLASILILVSKCLGGGGRWRVSIDSDSPTTPSSWMPSQHTCLAHLIIITPIFEFKGIISFQSSCKELFDLIDAPTRTNDKYQNTEG